MPDIGPVPRVLGDNQEMRLWMQRVRDRLDAKWTYQSPFQTGDKYLWYDATGDLRVHTSAPTSDTAGTIVGTQS